MAVSPAVGSNTSQRSPWRCARELVLRFGWNTMAYQILNPGVDLWIAPDGAGVVGYTTCFGYRIVAGVPICAAEHLLHVTKIFEAASRREGKLVCYFGAQERFAEVLAQRGP